MYQLSGQLHQLEQKRAQHATGSESAAPLGPGYVTPFDDELQRVRVNLNRLSQEKVCLFTTVRLRKCMYFVSVALTRCPLCRTRLPRNSEQ